MKEELENAAQIISMQNFSLAYISEQIISI
jgi:hypothetical protein